MKPQLVKWACAGAVCLLVGFWGGWVARSLSDSEIGRLAVPDGISTPSRSSGSADSGEVAFSPADPVRRALRRSRGTAPVPDFAEQLRVEIEGMSTVQFSQELAKLIHDVEFSAESLERKAAMLRGMNPERAITTYFEYKKIYGIDPMQRDANLQSLLVEAAKADGAGCVEEIFRQSPEGIAEFGPFMHGWAKGNSQEAVQWFNQLDPQSPMYHHAMHGLFFGLAEEDPAYARTAYQALAPETMAPEDLQTVSSSMASSLLSNHGVAEAASFVNLLPEEAQVGALEGSLWSFDRQPAEEMVPWLAQYAGASGAIREQAALRLDQWTRADPAGALRWVSDFSATCGDAVLGGDFFSKVAGQVEPTLLESWLRKRPAHPGVESVRHLLGEPP